MNQRTRYLEQKGWIWQHAGWEEPAAAMLQDGLHLFPQSSEKSIIIPREKMQDFYFWLADHSGWLEEFFLWIAEHEEWRRPDSEYTYTADFDPSETDFNRREMSRYELLSCWLCQGNIPHTEIEHDQTAEIYSQTVFEEPVDPLDAPMDGQW